jgi:hypothetical protein
MGSFLDFFRIEFYVDVDIFAKLTEIDSIRYSDYFYFSKFTEFHSE